MNHGYEGMREGMMLTCYTVVIAILANIVLPSRLCNISISWLITKPLQELEE